MSAEVDLIRQAEGMLREQAKAATAPEAMHPWGDRTLPALPPEAHPTEVDGYLGGTWGTYYATMHPGVGLALADWLHTAGTDLWAHGPLCECGTGCDACDDNLWEPHVRAALVLARLIVGEPS